MSIKDTIKGLFKKKQQDTKIESSLNEQIAHALASMAALAGSKLPWYADERNPRLKRHRAKRAARAQMNKKMRKARANKGQNLRTGAKA